jgi:hypothetical protein
MAVKQTNIFHCKTLQNLPTLGFGFENMPSGNRGFGQLMHKWSSSYVIMDSLDFTYSLGR